MTKAAPSTDEAASDEIPGEVSTPIVLGEDHPVAVARMRLARASHGQCPPAGEFEEARRDYDALMLEPERVKRISVRLLEKVRAAAGGLPYHRTRTTTVGYKDRHLFDLAFDLLVEAGQAEATETGVGYAGRHGHRIRATGDATPLPSPEQRLCDECAMISNPRGLSVHQKSSGHVGWTVSSEAAKAAWAAARTPMKKSDPEKYAASKRESGRRFGALHVERLKSDPEYAAKLRENVRRMNASNAERMKSDPEYAAKMREVGRKVGSGLNAKQWVKPDPERQRHCDECAFSGSQGWIRRHQKASGHVGWTGWLDGS